MVRRADALSLEVRRASLDFPRIAQFALAGQIRRAAKSICAHRAEGFGRQQQSTPKFRRFVMMAPGSANEMRVWSLYCRDLGDIGSEDAEPWQSGYREMARMLAACYARSSDI